MALALFRAAQESLTNVIRHAHAASVELSIEADAEFYRVRVIDDGVGMDVERVRVAQGLSGVRHRIASLGGRFELISSPGKGTRVAAAPENGGRVCRNDFSGSRPASCSGAIE